MEGEGLSDVNCYRYRACCLHFPLQAKVSAEGKWREEEGTERGYKEEAEQRFVPPRSLIALTTPSSKQSDVALLRYTHAKNVRCGLPEMSIGDLGGRDDFLERGPVAE